VPNSITKKNALAGSVRGHAGHGPEDGDATREILARDVAGDR
jgi:hypothetical protein